MLLTIQSVISPVNLKKIRDLLAKAEFVDGTLSAGNTAKRVKQNEELASNDNAINELNNLVMNSLITHPEYQTAALPLHIATPFYARYIKGMAYGDHVDDPVMGPAHGQRYRSDVSITIFLNEPDEYNGGELVISSNYGKQSVKLKAGDAIMYPSSSVHQVNTVTDGERLVAVTWLQSMIRDTQQRELLYTLNKAREHLIQTAPESEHSKHVDISYVNLVRMWSDI